MCALVLPLPIGTQKAARKEFDTTMFIQYVDTFNKLKFRWAVQYLVALAAYHTKLWESCV